MNYLKRIIVLSLSMVILSLLFFGCNVQSDNSTSQQSTSSQTVTSTESFVKYGYARPCDKDGNDIGILIGAYNSANTYMKIYSDNTVELLHRANAVTITGYLEGSTLHGTRNDEKIELYCAVHNDTVIVEYIKPDEYVQYLLFEKED